MKLREHLLKTASVAEQLSKGLKIGLDREAYLAALFHDVGKADVGARLGIASGYGCPGYEVVSAVVAFEALGSLPLEQRFTVVLAIMRHSQAMRSAQEALGRTDVWFEGKLADPGELQAALEEGLARFGLQPSFTWPASYKELEKRIREMQKVFEKFYSHTEHVLRARLLAGLVSVADTYAE